MKSLVAVLTVVLASSLSAVSASAHRFNLALLIPLSGPSADHGNQIRSGVIIATQERDAHAGEESDGHLGGLDVYLHTIDDHGEIQSAAKSLLARVPIDIVAVFGPEAPLDLVRGLIAKTETVLLEPGQLPFSASTDPAAVSSPAVRAFVAAYKRQYGHAPSIWAARGYHAARRIDRTVRALGGVSDKRALRRALAETATGFDW